MKNLLFTLFAIFAVYGLSLAQQPDDYSFKQQYDIGSGGKMSISTGDGYIKAYGKNVNAIEVYFVVRKNGKVQDMELAELREHLKVDIEQSGDQLEISVKQKETNWAKDWRNRHHVSFFILAPEQTECNLSTSDGDVEMARFFGRQQCKTSDGNIQIEDIKGDLTARTSDGDIRGTSIQGDMELGTSDGDIVITDANGVSTFKTSDGEIEIKKMIGDIDAVTSDGNILFDQIDGELKARTSDGNIEFSDIKGGLTAQTSDGNIEGDFAELKQKVHLKTSDGNISVTVPDGLGMDIRMKGEDINTRLEGFSGNTGDHLVEGTMHGGGVQVELVTSDGEINLMYN